mgnify:CR=1 FL=1
MCGGVPAHDARLVAAMQCYGIDEVMTFNPSHFRKFGVKVLDPANYP